MGVRDLRDAFQLIVEPFGHSCQHALLHYERKDDRQFQRLTFRGIRADGSPFLVTSDLVPKGGDVMEAARNTARTMAVHQ